MEMSNQNLYSGVAVLDFVCIVLDFCALVLLYCEAATGKYESDVSAPVLAYTLSIENTKYNSKD